MVLKDFSFFHFDSYYFCQGINWWALLDSKHLGTAYNGQHNIQILSLSLSRCMFVCVCLSHQSLSLFLFLCVFLSLCLSAFFLFLHVHMIPKPYTKRHTYRQNAHVIKADLMPERVRACLRACVRTFC